MGSHRSAIMAKSHKFIALILLLALVTTTVNARITNCNMACNKRNKIIFSDPGFCDNGATGKVLLWNSDQTRSYACEKCKYPRLRHRGPPACWSFLTFSYQCCD